MYKGFILFVFMLSSAFAGQTEQDFKRFKDFSKSLGNQPMDHVRSFKPEKVFEDYTTNPQTQKYYQGVENEKNDLTLSAKNALKNDKAGQTIVDNFGKHQFEINKNNEAIKRAQLIEEESSSIVHGQSNERINCDEAKKQCEIKTIQETCYTSRTLPDQSCKMIRKITVSKEKTHKTINFYVTIPKKWTGAIAVNLKSGAISGGAGGQVSSTLQLSHPCDQMSTTVHSVLNNGAPAYWVGITQLPSCSNGSVIYLYVSKKFKRYYPVQVSLTVDAISKPFVSKDEWEDSCLDIKAQGSLCHVKKEQCTDTSKMRVIDGLQVTRPCWEKTLTYSCVSAHADECQIPKQKGCMQISSKCARIGDNSCDLYEQTYSCETESCRLPIACTKNLYCVDGDCSKATPTENENFGEDVSAIAAVGEASNQYRQGNPTLFAGSVARCKIWPLDALDCCSDKGWGEKLNLAHCRDEDKALGRAKLDYKVHYLGKYCSKKELGICIEHKRTYCVFNSKLARIIHEEGRLRQINQGALGTAKYPNCGGLTPEELQRIDMGKIDFIAPVYPFQSGIRDKKAGIADDMAVNNPKDGDLVNKTSQRIKERMEATS